MSESVGKEIIVVQYVEKGKRKRKVERLMQSLDVCLTENRVKIEKRGGRNEASLITNYISTKPYLVANIIKV